MISALVVIMVIGGVVTALLVTGISFNRESDQRLERERCLQLAEAGLAESLVAMRQGLSGAIADDTTPARLGDGVVWVTATPVSTDVTRVVSSAMLGGARVSLESLVFHYLDPSFDVAIFASESLQISSNVLIDSYDPSLGSYASQLSASGTGYVNDEAVLQTNGDVQVGATSDIYGDIHPGTGGTLVTAGNATISGITEAMPEDRTLPPVITPAIPLSGSYAASGAVTLPPGDHGFTSFQVSVGASLTVQGPARLVVTDWKQAANSHLVLDASGGPIEIYVSGGFVTASNSSVSTPSQSAVDVALNLTGGPSQVAKFRSNGEFHGTIYAPGAEVVFSSNFELFGAVATRAMVLSSNVKIHYDEELHSDSPPTETYLSSSWSPVAFPRADWISKRLDPFVLVGAASSSLPSPSAAHQP